MLPLVEEVKDQLPRRRADILQQFPDKLCSQISLDRLLSHAGQGNTELYELLLLIHE